jgi:hypothetical protein
MNNEVIFTFINVSFDKIFMNHNLVGNFIFHILTLMLFFIIYYKDFFNFDNFFIYL